MVDASEKPLVTLTGITGYLGSQTCLMFLQDGGFRVRGTVRDKNCEARIAPLREAFGDLFDQLELVEADLLDCPSMQRAIAGSTYVVHLASPFFMSEDESVLVPPAINGTLSVMKACEADGVRRVVITSSCASVNNPAQADMPADRTFNESHWSNPDRPEGLSAYFKSKVLAEKAAWDFQAALADDKKFEVVTICPAFIMGPPLRKENFTSGGWCKHLMTGGMTEISADHHCAVDVRDTARAHLQAIKVAEAANRRFILCHSSPSFQEYAQPIVDKYQPLGWPITSNKADPNPEEYISLFDNTASREVLGIEYTDWSKTMVDMADKMVELGSVVKP